MKVKITRVCAAKGCNKEFKLYRSTDKYCSPACAYSSQKAKPKKKQIAIKPMSEKRKRESFVYSKKRKTSLALPENLVCPVCKAVYDGQINVKDFNPDDAMFILSWRGCVGAVEIHHKAGRRGKLLNYVPFWLAVSRVGHIWIHENPEKAYKLGFLIPSTSVNI